MSTNAPKFATLVTTPSSSMPGCEVARCSLTPSLKVAVLNSGRGSRPGFSSSARMSFTVGTPNCASASDSGVSVRSTRDVADQLARPERRSARRCARRPDRPPGGRRMRRAGCRRSMIRRKPAACWKVRSPSRGTFRICWRFAERPVLVAERDDVLGDRLRSGRRCARAAAPRRC